ncbi:efflux transporter outer membrane subunit [Solimonas marina]|uniref:Efflux transporter outer membrane subunit n=1 Tax=Solimonas marina TaxID=2714601 RepID=A0A969W8Q2_9GAMM|nr:efflux transporter outer membrane subunit [Solimonas marina]NKF21959.1 efflux transporter outer membrane subunit [Solimonas marina]
MKATTVSRVAASLAPALLLAACVLPPKEPPQATAINVEGLGLDGARQGPVTDGWWKSFGDPQLDALIDKAIASSPSLAEAVARVRSAHAQMQAAGAGGRPDFSINGNEVRQRLPKNYIYPAPYAGGEYWVGQIEANMSWDLDFWGEQKRLLDQAKLSSQASELDVESARLALAGSIAQSYVNLYTAYAMADIATQAEQQREALLKLTEDRVHAGLDTQLDVKSAEALLPQAREQRLQAEASRDMAVHSLAALSGQGANAYVTIKRPALKLDAALPLPQDLPIDLLAHRPDVLAARARVEAAMAGRAAAKAAFYPQISLTALAGYQSVSLDTLLHGSSGVWGFGPSVHLPIFDSQRLKASYRGATADLDTAVAQYNQTVLDAVRDVADQLTRSRSLMQQLDQSQQTLAASEAAFDLAKRRYAAGLTSRLVVLNAESNVLSARRDVVTVKSNLVIARVTLLLTLGGSFNPQPPDADAGAGATS